MSLLPQEHGAYGQIGFPLATSFAVAGLTMPAVLTGLSAVAGFLAHEPVLVLLGRRGARARRKQGRRAGVWLAVTATTGGVAGLTALWLVPAGIRWSFAAPLLAAALLGVAIASNREKSAIGEVAAALTGSLLALPVCLAAGAPSAIAIAVAAAFASMLVAETLAVRVVILSTRGGGNPRATRITRYATWLWSAAAAVGLGTAAAQEWLPWGALGAAVPGLLAAIFLAATPPPPTRLRVVGWTLIGTSAATALSRAPERARGPPQPPSVAARRDRVPWAAASR